MILRAPALVTARDFRGWERPMIDGLFNYRDTHGKPANINGIAQYLPAGCDIAPHINYLNGVNDPNLMCIGRYTPPTRCTFYLKREGNLYAYVDTDCELKDEGGNSLKFVSNQYALLSAGKALGTAMSVEFSAPSIGVNKFIVSSMRGAVMRVTRYEEGPDGTVTPAFRGSEASGAVATRMSDDTEQILTAGQTYCRPGRVTVYMDAVTSGGTYSSLVWEVAIDYEVPYGL